MFFPFVYLLYADSVLNGRIVNEQRIWKDAGGSCHGIVEVLSWDLLRGTEENLKETSTTIICVLAGI
jgi:hypothetical protein